MTERLSELVNAKIDRLRQRKRLARGCPASLQVKNVETKTASLVEHQPAVNPVARVALKPQTAIQIDGAEGATPGSSA